MPNRSRSPKKDSANQSPTQPCLPETAETAETAEMAEMIAEGKLPVPMEWPPHRLQPLLDLVHGARRRRLVKFVARVIANDILRQDRRQEQEEC
jgi:hypothetical protein